nr:MULTISPECIES: N-6 DNA methylase [unclassified Campylobacter]
MGQMYSEFLKYALGDGKELGIVLTHPYITKMMAQILEIDEDCKVMDLATGSTGFLISAMELMIERVKNKFSKNSTKTNEKIKAIKQNKLLGVEYNAEMFTLATTNMILRGDESLKIQKANTFDTLPSLYEYFKATRILLNSPFTWDENGMPFIEFGLRNMQKGWLVAIIIQDSAGSGKATKSNTKILKNHTLKASIKMPMDLFQPMAGVQTSIYIFETKIPHDFEKPVKFIDFRNDGYKRTKNTLQEISNPELRYKEIINIYKAGKNAKITKDLWDIDKNLYRRFYRF